VVCLVVCLFDLCRMQIDITVMSSCNTNSESGMLKKVRVMGFGYMTVVLNRNITLFLLS
jgi:hypothetical protein